MSESKLKIILIYYDKEFLEMLKYSLDYSNFDCSIFQNPFEAINEFKYGKYDVVITNSRLPNMKGIEVIQEIRRMKEDANIIYTSGFEPMDISNITANRNTFLLQKPFRINDLKEILERLEN